MTRGRAVRPARRNLSPYEWLLARALDHRPASSYADGDPIAWRDATLGAVLATLGRLPASPDPRPELVAEWPIGGLRAQRWLIDIEDGLSCSVRINIPGDVDGPTAAIMCWHGHGPVDGLYGKDVVMGDRSSPGREAFVTETGTDYGVRMAQAGYVTFAIDWMGHGDLAEARKPNNRRFPNAGDWCDIHYLHTTLLGMTPLGLNVAHGRTAVDFVASLPVVDAERLGVMGLSGGGTLAVWSSLADPRLRAVEVIGYSQVFADLAYRDLEACGSQVTPGLFELVDIPDLQGLIVPRPLLVDIAAHDEVFPLDSALRCWHQVRAVYEAAGLADRIELNLGPGGHGWDGARSRAFFDRWLGPTDIAAEAPS